jgi:hypothetical protein
VLNNLTKSGKNAFKNSSELIGFMRRLYHNQSLMKVFIANSKILDKSCYTALFELLERNLEKRVEAEEQERVRWNRRRTRLQQLNPKLDLAFRFEHLSREQLVADGLFQAVKHMLQVRLKNPKVPIDSLCDYSAHLIDFQGFLDPSFVTQFLESLSTFFGQHSGLDLAQKGFRLSKVIMLLRRMKEKNTLGQEVNQP